MMNKYNLLNLFALLLVTILLNSCEDAPVVEPQDSVIPRVLVNGVPLQFDAREPVLNDQLVMIPAKEVFERLGYTCTFSDRDESLVCIKDSETIVFIAGELQAILNQTPVYQLVSPYLKEGELLVEARFLEELTSILLEWDEETASLQIYDYNELDYGLYFYDKEPNGWGSWDAVGCQKFVAGQENPFYDPSKPTMIWIHGWQNGGVSSKSRPGFHFNRDGIDKFVHEEWIKQGWNVAIFHWVPFADELLPYDAESKINSASNNSVDMRWKKADGSYVTENMPTEPIAELFAQAYAQVAQTQINPTIRLAGSSFGGQVTLHGVERIKNNGITPLPSRIALLDMAWTSNYVNNQGLYTTEITSRAAQDLSPLIPIEYYRTSLLTTFFTPDELIEESAFQEMVFDYAGTWGIELKHTVITYHYFWSLEQEAPPAEDNNQQTVGVALSAKTADNTLRQMMGVQYHWQHIEGTNTIDPSDDVFERQNGPGY